LLRFGNWQNVFITIIALSDLRMTVQMLELHRGHGESLVVRSARDNRPTT
jgi:hypothetical protein